MAHLQVALIKASSFLEASFSNPFQTISLPLQQLQEEVGEEIISKKILAFSLVNKIYRQGLQAEV